MNWYSGANTYNYAVSGAVCSRTITAHKGVGIQEYEIPAFLADKAIVTGGQPFLLTPVNETVYSIWIGTNDLGWNAFLTHEEEPGKTLNDYVDCVFKTFDQIYAAGGRYLVLMNNIPLQLAPMYADAAHGGLNWTHFWPERPTNTTLVSQQIESNVQTANSLFKSKLEAISKEGTRYAAAQVALFDTYQLVRSLILLKSSTSNIKCSSKPYITIQESTSMAQRHLMSRNQWYDVPEMAAVPPTPAPTLSSGGMIFILPSSQIERWQESSSKLQQGQAHLRHIIQDKPIATTHTRPLRST